MPEDQTQNQSVDTGRQQVGTVYAKAFLSSSTAQADLDGLLDEFSAFIDEVLNPHPELDAILSSPQLSSEEKAGVLDRVAGSKLSDALLTFFKVVCAHGRLDCLRDICRAARKQWDSQKGVLEVSVTTAEPVDEGLRSRISEALTKSTGSPIRVNAFHDENLIGGLVVRVGDRVYDASVANQLAQLRHETVEKTVQQMREAGARFALAE